MNKDTTPLNAIDNASLAEADKLLSVILLLKTREADGTQMWSYVAVAPTQLKALKLAELSGEHILIEKYGVLLAQGVGAEPPAEVVAEMERRWNVQHDYEARVHEIAKNLK